MEWMKILEEGGPFLAVDEDFGVVITRDNAYLQAWQNVARPGEPQKWEVFEAQEVREDNTQLSYQQAIDQANEWLEFIQSAGE